MENALEETEFVVALARCGWNSGNESKMREETRKELVEAWHPELHLYCTSIYTPSPQV
jgi:hypothetical protein